jgi:dolichol-phosphate mannosyltransferase
MSVKDGVSVSVIVPAYHEVNNLPELIRRVFAAFDKSPPLINGTPSKWIPEMVIVDDNSNDGSREAVEKAAATLGVDARIVVRTNERGLSSAVLRGFDEAKGDYLLCMDADLQHPPEKVPHLLQRN